MLQQIAIKNIATFDQCGIKLDNLRKINFIYGNNGTGKTTISNYLASSNENDKYHDCSLSWEAGTALKVLVYNKKFRDENFGKGNINGVFTLGHATKEELELIENKRKDLSLLTEDGKNKKKSLEKLKSDLQSLQDEFKESAWKEIYKKYEKIFKEAFRGYLYKNTFAKRLVEEYDKGISEDGELNQLIEKSKIVFAENIQTLPLLSLFADNELSKIEQDSIWNKKIIGKSDVNIGELIQRLNINDWVNEGRKYIQDDSNLCPFCQKETITNDFKRQLQLYFDETFNADIQTIQSYEDKYISTSIELITFLETILEKERLNPKSKLDLDNFGAVLKVLSGKLTLNKEHINAKHKEPSRSIGLVSTNSELSRIKELLTNANNEILKYNQIVENLNTEKQELIVQIWNFVASEYGSRLKEYIERQKGLESGIKSLEDKLTKLRSDFSILNNQIKDLTKNVTSVQPSIDEINRILQLYGFTNFQIVPSPGNDNQYQIQREDGSLAETTLSEGEITFITFLYFMQLAKGSIDKNTIVEDRILVIDDPVSSLDSNVLFVVSSLIKELIKQIKKNETNIKQLIVLTHNVYFHKEVSFIDGRTLKNGDTYYWILRKINNITKAQGFEMNNPIVGSYELLWKELKAQQENGSGLTVQNIMRRIIENYFKILGKFGDDDLIKKFANPQEQEICRSLICWINDGSHSLPDDLYIEAPFETIEKYFEVFKKIFQEMGHEDHYNMMMA